ncbi:hypothetical protein PSG98_14385, partial [Enterococcus faecalis]|nr:hypothetical protein [Enterococcus faecalis]
IVIPPAIFFYYSTLFDSRFKTLQQNHLCDEIRNRYGFKALVHASSLLPGATAISRSSKIGGH